MNRYIVTDSTGRPLCLGHYGDGPDVLVSGSDVTLFKKPISAVNAIRRTRTYAKANGLPWDLRHEIKPVTVTAR